MEPHKSPQVPAVPTPEAITNTLVTILETWKHFSVVIETLRAEALPIVEASKQISVATTDEYARGGEALVLMKTLKKRLVKEYKSVKDPLNAIRGSILDSEKLDVGNIESAATELEGQLIGFRTLREKAAAAQQADAQAAADKAASKLSKQFGTTMAAPRVEIEADIPDVEGLHSAGTWGIEVVDLAKVPRKFLILDEVAVRRLAVEHKENFNTFTMVPGVRAVKNTSLKARS